MNLIEQLREIREKEKIEEGVWKAIVNAKEISVLTIEPGGEIPLHKHVNDHEIYIVLKGMVRIDGIACTEGNIRICNCGESHRAVNTFNTEVIILAIKIGAE